MVKFIINWEIIFDIVQLVGYLQSGVDCTLNEEKKITDNYDISKR